MMETLAALLKHRKIQNWPKELITIWVYPLVAILDKDGLVELDLFIYCIF